MSPKTTSSSLSLSPSSPLSYSTTSSSSSSLPSSSLLSRAATTSSVGSSASDGKAPFPRGRQRGGPSSPPPCAGPLVRALSRRNPLPPVVCRLEFRASAHRRGSREEGAFAPALKWDAKGGRRLPRRPSTCRWPPRAYSRALSRLHSHRPPRSAAAAGPPAPPWLDRALLEKARHVCCATGRGFGVAEAHADGHRRGRTGSLTTEVARHGSWIAVCGFSTASRPSLTTWHRCSRVRCSSAFSLPARPPLPSSSFFHPPLVLVES